MNNWIILGGQSTIGLITYVSVMNTIITPLL